MKQKVMNKTLLLSTLICLLPMILSLALYSQLPEQVATHWDSAGIPNGYSPKAFAAFGLPSLMALFNVLAHFMMNTDPKRKNANPKLRAVGLWTCPLLSVILVPITLFWALGVQIPIVLVCSCLVGLIFVIVGNYLPKTGQSYTVGMRFPWTLNDPENWKKTSHLSGYLFIIGGILIFLNGFVGVSWLLLPIILLVALIPAAYSYLLYRKTLH